MTRSLRNSWFQAVAVRAAGLALAAFATFQVSAFWIGPPPVILVTVREYTNDLTHHYVLLSDPAEIRGVESGAAGPGWRFTGYEFDAYRLDEPAAVAANAVPVCRFYAPPPTNSHFFTANAQECEFLRTHDTGWIYEKSEFKVDVPQGGACAATLTPVHRQYNNRWMYLDSNHRFSVDSRVEARMAAEGWIDEGIAFCAAGGGRAMRTSQWIAATGEAPGTACTTRPGAAPCISLGALPDMTQTLSKYLPPTYSQLNPGYSPAFAEVTGWVPFTDTVFSAALGPDAPAHSFVEWVGMPIGVHVVGRDRLQGDYASVSPTYRYNAMAGAADPRVFPWGDGHEHDLFMNFQLAVKTVRRAVPGSQAYGAAVIDFVDGVSNHHLEVTVLAFGTQAPGDFVGRDVASGATIVSTTFRPDPLFGQVLRGQFIPCEANATSGSCHADGIDFGLRIDERDFAKIVGLARANDPALSPDIADYYVGFFQVRNETYLDAEIGLEEHAVALSLSY
ncbi:MAG TPA: hypothetical protein VFP36_07355 [Usitatibacter sp.]|nr:hypothetical protein [Usitatibacter sp.]